jgi:hypothetical protein
MRSVVGNRAVPRPIISGGVYSYTSSARQLSFEIKLTSTEIRRAEHEYMDLLYTQALDMSYSAM